MNLKRLDNAFSKFIRLRDRIDGQRCRCISCNAVWHWKDMDAGHFIPRTNMATRYEEMNVHAQCEICNRTEDGNSENYEARLRIKYGDHIVAYLKKLSHNTAKYTQAEINEMTKHYNKLIKQMK